MTELPWVFSRFGLQAAIDIIAVTVIMFWLFSAIRGTAATQLMRGIVVLLLAAVIAGSVLQLSTLNWLIRNSIPALLVAIPVVFQPELRRGLQKLGGGSAWQAIPFGKSASRTTSRTLCEVAKACGQLAEQRFGALIVLERQTGLQDYVENGVAIDATVSSSLITSLFYPGSPLHDGAVIINHDRVLAASCVLPLSETAHNKDCSGTRHRAALGLSERSDAIVIAVSEEQGIISLANGGTMMTRLNEEALKSQLFDLFLPGEKAFYEPR
jgi:diadenylate cyclase